MRIGDYEITLIETGDFALDGGAMFGVVPKRIHGRDIHGFDIGRECTTQAVSDHS